MIKYLSNIYRNTRDNAKESSARYKQQRVAIQKGKFLYPTKFWKLQKKKYVDDDQYSFADDYQQQPQRQLVLFTSAESGNSTKIKYDIYNHLRMYTFFQRHYNFKAIVFSKSPLIAEICQEYNITVVDHYLTNMYNLPLIRDLFQQAFHLIRSRFYGYVNSDILMSPVLFPFLAEVDQRIQQRDIPNNVTFHFVINCRLRFLGVYLIRYIMSSPPLRTIMSTSVIYMRVVYIV